VQFNFYCLKSQAPPLFHQVKSIPALCQRPTAQDGRTIGEEVEDLQRNDANSSLAQIATNNI
jgi:hypothetical protein